MKKTLCKYKAFGNIQVLMKMNKEGIKIKKCINV